MEQKLSKVVPAGKGVKIKLKLKVKPISRSTTSKR